MKKWKNEKMKEWKNEKMKKMKKNFFCVYEVEGEGVFTGDMSKIAKKKYDSTLSCQHWKSSKKIWLNIELSTLKIVKKNMAQQCWQVHTHTHTTTPSPLTLIDLSFLNQFPVMARLLTTSVHLMPYGISLGMFRVILLFLGGGGRCPRKRRKKEKKTWYSSKPTGKLTLTLCDCEWPQIQIEASVFKCDRIFPCPPTHPYKKTTKRN